MGTQSIFAVCRFLCEGSEKPALVSAVDTRAHLADRHRCTDAAVIPLVLGRDCNLAGVDIDILVTLNLLYLHFSSGHMHAQIRFPRHLDFDVKAIAVAHMAPLNCQSAALGVWRESKEDMAGRSFAVSAAARDVDRFLIRSNDFEACRP